MGETEDVIESDNTKNKNGEIGNNNNDNEIIKDGNKKRTSLSIPTTSFGCHYWNKNENDDFGHEHNDSSSNDDAYDENQCNERIYYGYEFGDCDSTTTTNDKPKKVVVDISNITVVTELETDDEDDDEENDDYNKNRRRNYARKRKNNSNKEGINDDGDGDDGVALSRALQNALHLASKVTKNEEHETSSFIDDLQHQHQHQHRHYRLHHHHHHHHPSRRNETKEEVIGSLHPTFRPYLYHDDAKKGTTIDDDNTSNNNETKIWPVLMPSPSTSSTVTPAANTAEITSIFRYDKEKQRQWQKQKQKKQHEDEDDIIDRIDELRTRIRGRKDARQTLQDMLARIINNNKSSDHHDISQTQA